MATIRRPGTGANHLQPTATGGKISAVGIPWYAPEDYAAARAIMADRESRPLTYEDWLHRILQTEREQIAQGHTVLRIIIDPRKFPGWCAIRGLSLDTKARAAFAAEEAARQIGL